jgi:hypothetical protein
MGIRILFQRFIASPFITENGIAEQLFRSIIFPELYAQFGKIEDEISAVEFLDVALVELDGFLVVVGGGVGTTKITDDGLVIWFLGIGFFVGR